MSLLSHHLLVRVMADHSDDFRLIDPSQYDRDEQRINYWSMFFLGFLLTCLIIGAFWLFNVYVVVGAIVVWSVMLLIFAFMVWRAVEIVS